MKYAFSLAFFVLSDFTDMFLFLLPPGFCQRFSFSPIVLCHVWSLSPTRVYNRILFRAKQTLGNRTKVCRLVDRPKYKNTEKALQYGFYQIFPLPIYIFPLYIEPYWNDILVVVFTQACFTLPESNSTDCLYLKRGKLFWLTEGGSYVNKDVLVGSILPLVKYWMDGFVNNVVNFGKIV